MPILARVDYNLRIDHTIMQELLAYLDTILADPGVYLTRLYRTWSTHYITNHVGTDVLEVLVSGRRRACWNVRPIRSETPTSLVDPAQSEFIQRYYSQLIEHSIKKGHRRMAWHCRIRWDDCDRTHSNVIALTHDELTGQWNATIIEPSVTMCPPFVRLIRRLFAASPTLCMCKVQWVASHVQKHYGMYCKRLGYVNFPACRHLTLFLAHRWLHGESIQYQSIAATDVERQLHRPFLSFCERVLDADVEHVRVHPSATD